MISLAQDWEILRSRDSQSALLDCQRLTWTRHCIALLRAAVITQHRRSDAEWVYGQVEKLISTRVSSNDVLSAMLLAPYKNPDRLQACAEEAIAFGYAATAQILHRLLDLQPLLNRLANSWLGLPVQPFLEAGTSKQQIWKRLLRSSGLISLLEANTRERIANVFGSLAFDESAPRARSAIAKMGLLLAEDLFGPLDIQAKLVENSSDEEETAGPKVPESWKRSSDYQKLNRALKEIEAISAAVARGDDALAEKFLTELVSRQISESTSREHVVKSLCNIAKECADMFRTDFESQCLQKALGIDPTDSWALIQMGDHLKRVGRYQEARATVEQAISGGQTEVGLSLLADIVSQQGDYQRAIEEYRKIPDWREIATIRTAIADNMRRMGEFDQAEAEYLQIERDGLGSDRTVAGRAEIAKREGRLEEAAQLYRSLLNNFKMYDSNWWTYQLSLASTLKQLGELNSALTLTEEIIEKFPFAMHARVLRASLWGLLDKVSLGLDSLPDASERPPRAAYGEWVKEYTRGLLLIRANRYQDALQKLTDNLQQSILEGEERTILRLASALAYIAKNDTKGARLFTSKMETKPSAIYLQHLAQVLEYHISVSEGDEKSAAALYRKLLQRGKSNVLLWRATSALKQRDFDAATRFEVDAMLSLAA